MYLSLFLGLFFMMYNANAVECQVAKDIERYKTKTITVDDVVFHLHFPEDRPWFTQKVIDSLVKDIPLANRYFRSKPQGEVHLVTESASQSNGMATVFPYNIITLNDFPPLGQNYLKGTDEWIRNLVVHEYTHILTMDMTHGWIDSLRKIFGSAVKTNGIIPRWLNEGVAVWFESQFPGQGRLNQKGVKYQVYKALSDKNFCQEIECLDMPLKYPYGHAPYWIGGEFVKYIEELNPGFLRCVFKEHSHHVPFFLNKMFKICVGMNITEAYANFKKFYIDTNSYLKNYCPTGNQFCSKLEKYKIDETIIDFEAGTCSIGDNLLYIRRDELGRGRFYIPYKVELLNSSNGFTSSFNSQYPIETLSKKNNRCIIKQRIRSGCSTQFIFSEIKVPDLKTNALLSSDSSILDIELNKNQIYEVSYKDGLWNYIKNDKNFKSFKSEIRPKFNEEDSSSEITFEKSRDTDYQGSLYLKPEYFLVNYSNFANLSALNLNTSLTDPLKSHYMALSITDYISAQEGHLWGGAASYRYTQNDWRLSTNIYKGYYVSSLIDNVATNESAGVQFSKFSQIKSWKLATFYGLRFLNKNDFISHRKANNIFMGTHFDKINNHIFRKQKSLKVSYTLSFHDVETTKKENFLGIEGHLNQSFYIGKQSQYGYSLNYGKYFKDNLNSGYLAAGGMNNYFASGYQYPLYMISYANLIGNELTTSRMYYGSRLTNFFKGFGMFPAFIKNSGYEVGAEYAKGKYILTSNNIYKNNYGTGLYAKYYLNTKLAYIWDATISLTFSQVQYPTKINRILFLFDGATF